MNCHFVLSGLAIATGILLTSMCAAEPTAKPKVVVLNKGIGGNNTFAGLRRFDRDVLAHKPTHLVLYFGMNDACNSHALVPLETYRKNLQTMIDKARAAGIENIVLVTPNPIINDLVKARHPKHPESNLQTHLDTYGAAVHELAVANKLLLADLRKAIDDRGGANMTKTCLIRNPANGGGKDGVHFTPDGYRVMAEVIAPLLRDRVKAGDTIVCFGDSLTYGAHVNGAGTSTGETYPARLSVILNTSKDRP